MATCADCRFWRAPMPMALEAETIALSRGVNRDGACHRFPKPVRCGGTHDCGEHRPAPKPIAEAA